MNKNRNDKGRFVAGSTPTNKGNATSEEIKEKISKSKKGQRCSVNTEFKSGMLPHNKGVPMSEETKKKISESKKNSIPCNKGKKLSPEHVEKLKASHKGKPSPKKGIKLSPEHVEKLRNAVRRKPVFTNKISRRGKDSANWKGGVTPETKRIRNSKEYQIWRSAVFERDAYRCQDCSKERTYLEVHHVKEFSKHPHLRFDINNGITLCKDCHRKVRGKEEEFEDYFYALMISTAVINNSKGE